MGIIELIRDLARFDNSALYGGGYVGTVAGGLRGWGGDRGWRCRGGRVDRDGDRGRGVSGRGGGARPDIGGRDPGRASVLEVLPGHAEGPAAPARPQPVKQLSGAARRRALNRLGWHDESRDLS